MQRELPVIDWELGIKLAGNKPELAADLLAMLVNELPSALAEINTAYANKDYATLQKLTHKLHGGVVYCGLPRLKTLLMQIEVDLKKNITNHLPSLIEQLNTEVKLVCEQHAKESA
jgi:two-component system sensor histidine kinase BarA